MILTVASLKGGQGKSTTAVHLAEYLSHRGETLLIDGDPNRSVSRWAEPGKLPFHVIGSAQAAMAAHKYRHIVIDTKARPETEDVRDLAQGCHLLILPCTPDTLSLDTLRPLIGMLDSFQVSSYRVLLTIVPPAPIREGDLAREALVQAGIPLFRAQIPRTIKFQRSVAEGITVPSDDYQAVGREIERLFPGLKC